MAKNEKDEKVARFIWSSWAKFAQSGEPGQGWPPFNNEEVEEAKRRSLHANALPPSPQHSGLKGTDSQKNKPSLVELVLKGKFSFRAQYQFENSHCTRNI